MENFIFCAVFVNLAESPIYWLMLARCLSHCFKDIQIRAEILYYRSPMILSVFGNLQGNEEMKKESQKNPQVSTVNLNIKNDFYVYCSNFANSEISICFFLIYHLESCILMLFFLRTEGNIFSFRMQSSEFFFLKKNAY